VMLAEPPVDFVVHNSVFLVAHFHNVIIGAVVWGCFAGLTYWWPKAFGFMLDERLGKAALGCWVIGFYVAFIPLYVLGLEGMTRRMQHYDNPAFTPWLLVAGAGAALIAAGIALQIVQIVVSIRTRDARRDTTGDPWGGRTLEWSTTSPPPPYNFAVLPRIEGVDAYWGMKDKGWQRPHEGFEPIEVPKNSALGFALAFLMVGFGFGMVWHIWWMAAAAFAAIFIAIYLFTWSEDDEREMLVGEIAHFENDPAGHLA